MAITFSVNLSTVNVLHSKGPYSSNDLLGSNFAATRSTFFPDLLINNRVAKHGDTFTESGMKALYLYNNYTSGTYKFLDYVSGSA